MPIYSTVRVRRPVRRSGSFILLLSLGLSMVQLDSTAAAQGRGAMRDVIRTLTSEAREVLERERLTISDPDFADRDDGGIDIEAAQQAIMRRQNRDPFIDAYIRWQLTSFDITLPEMSERDLTRFLQQIPSMVENPRADQRRVSFFERAAQTERLSAEQLAELQRLSRVLDEMTETAQSMNEPAAQFREWIRQQVDEAGNTRLALQLAAEQCAATIQAGWSTRAIKTEISQRCSEAARNDSLNRNDRQHVLATLQRLVGLERRSVNTITFMGDNSVRVTFSTGAVRNRDLENWRSRLFDESSDGDAS